MPNEPTKHKRGPREFQRAYKACVSCRSRKARCELGVGSDGHELGPPCLRCRRELRECIFPPERAWNKRQKLETASSGHASAAQREPVARADSPDADDNDENGRPLSRTGAGGTTNSNSAGVATAAGGGGGAGGPSPATRTPSAANVPHRVRRESQISQSPVFENLNESGLGLRSPSAGGPGSSLANSVVRTVVSSEKDALNLLFQAAQHEDSPPSEQTPPTSRARERQRPWNKDSTYSVATLSPSMDTVLQEGQSSSQDVTDLWNTCRFVQMGWFTADEAVSYIDLFFKNLCPHSPIISDFYANHANHRQLVMQDPLLCTTLLMISSRYNTLPGPGGVSRGYFIHSRLWEYCERLIMRVMFGQEKGPNSKIRTVGSIEALLLLSEWHPTALHFPPENDGWSVDIVTTVNPTDSLPQSGSSPSSHWLGDIIEPSRRSDRMSWMLVGGALSLAHELGLFNDEDDNSLESSKNLHEIDSIRKRRVRKLLYVFTEQLSSRLGCTSMYPQNRSHTVGGRIAPLGSSKANDDWQFIMAGWIELTKLARSVSEILFPSPSFTRQILRSGRYVGHLEHFEGLLNQWREKHLDPNVLGESLQDILTIEYLYVRVYTNALGMQAFVERHIAENDMEMGNRTPMPIVVDSSDYTFIQEVVDGSSEILEKCIKLAEAGTLRFAPVRVFLRIASSSIYLIKGLSLGVWGTKLQSALSILDQAIHALRTSSLDDIHLASRYGTLLELHVGRLKQNFVVSAYPPRFAPGSPPTAQDGYEQQQQQQQQRPQQDAAECTNLDTDMMTQPSPLINGRTVTTPHLPAFTLENGASGILSNDDWLSLPFDATIFGQAGPQTFLQDDGALDFIWNLPS